MFLLTLIPSSNPYRRTMNNVSKGKKIKKIKKDMCFVPFAGVRSRCRPLVCNYHPNSDHFLSLSSPRRVCVCTIWKQMQWRITIIMCVWKVFFGNHKSHRILPCEMQPCGNPKKNITPTFPPPARTVSQCYAISRKMERPSLRCIPQCSHK